MTLVVRRSPLVSCFGSRHDCIRVAPLGCQHIGCSLHSLLLQLAIGAQWATVLITLSSWHWQLPDLFAARFCCVPAAMARVFVLKVGVLPDRVLVPLLNDRMVAKVPGCPYFCTATSV